MTDRLAPRMARFSASPTVAATARANAARAAGRPVISLTTGEPDFDTPEPIVEAAIQAMRDGQTRYTAVDGTPRLKQAVIDKFARENGLSYGMDQVMVSTGAKQVIFNAILALIGAGDEVICPTPCWVSYPDMVKLAGGTPVEITCGPETGFKPTAQALAAALTPKTRAIMLNSPSNPTGAVLSADELRALGGVLKDRPDVIVICDDIYEHLTYPGTAFATLAAVCPELKDQVLTVNGVSKAYAMTGWRIGYGGGPAWLIRAMRVLQSQSTTNACSVAQAAAVAALDGGLGTVHARRDAFLARRDRLVACLAAMPGLQVRAPEGAFYLWVGIGDRIGTRLPDGTRIADEAAFVDALLDRHDLAVVGGAGFGASPYMRMTFAASDAELDAAMDRLSDFLASLTR
ncbi:aminotransferase class I/II-fold pyridoxal phosphate-dependent enzyme [Rhodobacteraceae bacterium 2CG4]|uniref:Aminotransferase n=1 Tax=Halovulum marinum TaxID=2662447 RepID=A0A6L5Z3P5_9RHOB|nr:pyridoxal phosphate-dependent aminotransferase [Halovulum marinum]MSU90632.1 aminotransferase class I/II-fold pyridoxal phosphate-dependent enzyme [Halovulum marinum]